MEFLKNIFLQFLQGKRKLWEAWWLVGVVPNCIIKVVSYYIPAISQNYNFSVINYLIIVVLIETDNTYINAATSANTRKAYQNDIDHFINQGGTLPATPEIVEKYLKICAEKYNPSTLIRILTSLRQSHKLQKHPDPTEGRLVIKTMKRVANLHGRPKQQAIG